MRKEALQRPFGNNGTGLCAERLLAATVISATTFILLVIVVIRGLRKTNKHEETFISWITLNYAKESNECSEEFNNDSKESTHSRASVFTAPSLWSLQLVFYELTAASTVVLQSWYCSLFSLNLKRVSRWGSIFQGFQSTHSDVVLSGFELLKAASLTCLSILSLSRWGSRISPMFPRNAADLNCCIKNSPIHYIQFWMFYPLKNTVSLHVLVALCWASAQQSRM